MKFATAVAVLFGLIAFPVLAEPDESVSVLRAGSQPTVTASTDHFTGTARVGSRFQRSDPSRLGGGVVTFEPGARTDWHTHPLGQTLFVTEGEGLVGHWGGAVQEMKPGDIVWIPPGVKHWHGAARDTRVSHLAIAEALDGKRVTWLEKVTDEQYGMAPER